MNADSGRPGRKAVLVVLAPALIVATAAVASCSTGPSTQAEVCGAYDELGRQVLQGNGLFGNPLFHKADDLAGVAKRYEAADLSSDAAALHRIAKSDSTNGMEIMQATTAIANLCGHPLGLGDTVG